MDFAQNIQQLMPFFMPLKTSDVTNNKLVAAAFLDLSKAFDSISHEILKKLEDYHFDCTAIALIKSYRTKRTQKVILQNTSSDWISLFQGVP